MEIIIGIIVVTVLVGQTFLLFKSYIDMKKAEKQFIEQLETVEQYRRQTESKLEFLENSLGNSLDEETERKNI